MRKFIASMTVLLAFGLTQAPIVFADGLAQKSEAQKETRTVKKYPPYPDVWDWVTPFPSRMSYRFQAELLPNGDVQLSYQLKSKSTKPTEDMNPQGEKHGVLFFGQKAVAPPTDFSTYHKKWRAVLPNGTIIRSSGAWETGNCFHLHNREFIVHNADETERGGTVLFFVWITLRSLSRAACAKECLMTIHPSPIGWWPC